MATSRQGQGAFTAVTELAEDRRAAVDAALRAARAELQDAFGQLPHLHFARLTILDVTHAGDHRLPACLVLATIHDGERAPHVQELAAAPALRALYEVCGVAGELGQHLSSVALDPMCFYNAHPGLTRELICSASEQRDALDAALQVRLAALGPRAPTADALLDFAHVPPPTVEQRALFGAAQVTRFSRFGRSLRRFRFYLNAAVLVLFLPALLGTGITLAARRFAADLLARAPVTWPWLAVGASLAIVVVALLWLRLRERADARADVLENVDPMPTAFAFVREERPRLDTPRGVAVHLRRVADEEDVQPKDAHNHLTHCSVLKPGIARRGLLRLVFEIVKLRAGVLDREGMLGGIPSIHFARWVLIDEGKPRRRLIFLSDYDGTWESYLGQFVDLAAEGLTGVWSNTERFPASWLLFGRGARQEQRFKLWTRLRQVETPVVYSHYPWLSVHAVRTDVDFCRRWAQACADSRENATSLTLLQSPTRGT